MQHRDRRVGREVLEQHELHVREHQRVSHCAMRSGPPPAASAVSAGRRRRAGAGHRVDTEPRPRELGEREPGDDLELDRSAAARSSATVRSATAGLPGTAYTTSPCACGGGDEPAAIPS